MAQHETWFIQDLKKPVEVKTIKGNVFSQDDQANIIGVEVLDNGSPATLSGTVSGYVIRQDNGTIEIEEGTLDGNKCSIVLPSAAYAVPGNLNIAIKLTNDEVVTTLLNVTGTVYRTSTDDAVYPGEVIPSINNLIEELDQTVAAMQVAADDIEEQKDTMIASIAAIAEMGTDPTLTQSGVAADAKATGDELSDLKSAIGEEQIITTLPVMNTFINSNNKWENNANINTVLVPVNGASVLKLKWNTSLSFHLAFLTSNSHSAGNTPDFCTGQTGRIILAPQQATGYTTAIPTGCKYIYFLSKNTGVDYSPTFFEVDGVDYCESVTYKIAKNTEEIETLKDENLAIEDSLNKLSAITETFIDDISYETSKLSFVANSEISAISMPFTKGLATRYPVEGDIKKVRAYCYLIGDTSSIDVICEIKKGDFSATLGSKTITAIPQNNGQYFDFVFDTPISTSEENVYICIYSTAASAKLGSSTDSFDTCTATETYKNRYMDFDSGSWFTVNNISNYCLYVWVYRPAYKEKSGGIIFVGQDESCDYSTIQEAIDGCNDSASNPVVIFIKNGMYDPISFTDSGRGLRHISLIGESRDNVIIYGDKGKYELPTAEIRTVGAIKNITFIQKTSAETYEPGGQYNYCYAMHDDYDGSNVEFDNCSFISNAGPAVGLGTRANLLKAFRNCYFESNGDGTFGNITLGAFYCHSFWANAENQGLIIENCVAINRYGDNGIRLDKLTGYTATFNAHVRNSWSFGRNGASALNTFDLTDSFGNNVSALNNM